MKTLFLLSSVALAAAPALAQQHEVQIVAAPPPPDGNLGHNFWVGNRVAISEEWVAVSDHTVDDGHGEIYLYRRTPQGWIFRQRLVGEHQSSFGMALAIQGDTLAVGAISWGGYSGKVYVFGWTGSAWVATQEIVAPELSDSDAPRFGYSVAISGDVMVVGAPSVDHPVEDAGEARIYERSGGTWQLAARFRLPAIPEVLNGDIGFLGCGVSVSGTTVVAGAPLSKGAVYVYERSASGWHEAAVVWNPTPQQSDTFGIAVSVSGDALAIGMPATVGGNYRPGRGYVFERDAAGAWIEAQEFRASDGYADADHGDDFGITLDLDGERLVVGAPSGKFNGPNTGTAYLFEREPSGWPDTESMRLVASDSSGQSDLLGWSVALEKDFAVAGAVGAWHEGVREGKAYVFAIDAGDPLCGASGAGGKLTVTGSTLVSDHRVVLALSHAPPGARCMFLLSPRPGSTPFGEHDLCIDTPLIRLGSYGTIGAQGLALHELSLQSSSLAGRFLPGSTWYFQCAHERFAGAGRLDALSNAASLTLE